MNPFETIVAPITAIGGAVAVVRISGPESWMIAKRLFSQVPEPVQARHSYYGKFANGDDGLLVLFEEGHSYTGEACVEMSAHGSRQSVSQLVQACLAEGARMARPGEFTERAFLNGRLDLTQAEGVRETVEAQTESQLRQAHLLREGALKERVAEMRSNILDVLSAIEASVDFSEEVGDLDRLTAASYLDACKQSLDELLCTAEAGRIVRQGYRIAIIGPPNAGKSSLLNAILGFDRAIVTPIPGTTRDFVEENVDLGGVPCVLIDTAGLRETKDPIEQLGIERTLRIAECADEVWYVAEAPRGWSSEDERALSGLKRPSRVLANKSDSLEAEALDFPPEALKISALTGEGLADLIASYRTRIGDAAEGVWINDRHAPLLASARDHVLQAKTTIAEDLPPDLATVHLQAAIDALGQVTGETAGEDILEAIFSRFCIGK